VHHSESTQIHPFIPPWSSHYHVETSKVPSLGTWFVSIHSFSQQWEHGNMPHECTREREGGRYVGTQRPSLHPQNSSAQTLRKTLRVWWAAVVNDERTTSAGWAMARGVLVWTIAIGIVMAASMVPVSLLVNSIVPHPYMVCHSHSVSVFVSLSFLIVSRI
jgi:hypothetical protein